MGKSLSSRNWIVGLMWVTGGLICYFWGVSESSGQGITPEMVREAIQRGVNYLKNTQNPDGSWGDWPLQPGARTSLCTLALLNAGLKPSEPTIQKALANLRKIRPDSTYAISLQTMVLCLAEPLRDLPLIRDNVAMLLRIQKQDGPRKGAWAYRAGLGEGDNSNSQFAILALYEADRVGVRFPERNWRLAKAYWEDCQNPDGSWGYYKGVPGTGSMTCAGIASLVICNEVLAQPNVAYDPTTGRILCCQVSESASDAIQRGLAWLSRPGVFAVSHNPGSRQWLFYYLYGLERVGRMTGRRFFGQHDWYREGCEQLVLRDPPDGLSGFWRGGGYAENDPLIATSLALLFLSKGRRPTLLAKLQYRSDPDWNRHPNDVAKLTRYVEPRWGLDLTWQSVDIRSASVEDLLQCPVLFMSGSLDPRPASPEAIDQLADKLRAYLERGGFLWAEANCTGQEFDQGFRSLVQRIFPEPEYRLRLLPPEHPIWRAEETVDPKYHRPILGVEFGCRTSLIYFPPHPAESPGPSLSCLWELSQPGRPSSLPAAVQNQIDAALSIGINVLAYATNRELKPKEYYLRRPEIGGSKDNLVRGRLAIASLRHPGGCTAAPRALRSLLETLHQELKLRVPSDPVELALTDEALFDYHLLFMHGRSAFRLTPAERDQLRIFLERGGTLFANAICGSQAFVDSFRQEMALLFPKTPLERVPPNDPLWTPAFGGFDLKTVSRRDPQPSTSGGKLRAAIRQTPPSFEGIKIDNRWAVLFSPYDLSCALEKHDSLECFGYRRDDAVRIAINVILYALHR
ncbi:MAG: DUF4159 domain-containing protein [Thermoguttaceae bacterium]|nr:DUF4159 domain-containing protein [Thermoguttaceae bacterium]MDW8039093.1 DUF4159 domain-containing protein [Thermoguttaceae bacterium]